MSIHSGELIRLTASFTDLAGAPADPTTVRLRVRANGAAEAIAPNVKDSVGNYHADVLVPWSAPAYRLHYRWEGTGAIVAALEGDIEVRTDWTALP